MPGGSASKDDRVEEITVLTLMSQGARQRYESLAKTLRYILANAPDEFGLVLDEEGWVQIKHLIQALNEEAQWKGITAARVIDLLWQLEPCPFEIDGSRIRVQASQLGTCTPPQKETFPPPAVLFLGIRRKSYPVVHEKGVQSHGEDEIVLARTSEMALRIGRRRDPRPILVEVHTHIAQQQGVRFLSYGAHLFLVKQLGPECLRGPSPKHLEGLLPQKRSTFRPARAADPSGPHGVAWNPSQDRLLARDPEEQKAILRRERDRKRVEWKDSSRRERRRGE